MLRIILLALLPLLLASCASSSKDQTPTLPADPKPYTRISRTDTNVVRLQMAMRKFVPVGKRGPAVWLVGASHIGDRDYYRALQKHLDAQTTTLFEGINASAHPRRAGKLDRVVSTNAAAAGSEAKPLPPRGPPGMQSTLAESLGLVFQLDAIDYERTNFLNSDLSIAELQKLMTANTGGTKPAEAEAAGQTFQSLLQMMDGSSFLGVLVQFGLKLIGSNAKAQAITKLAFIEILGRLDGDLAGMTALPSDVRQLMKVLIVARNQHVLADLQIEARKLRRSGSIAIFYGAGHMDDMEKHLTRELNYRPDGEIWLTAFSVDMHATGLSASEVQMVQNLVKWQMSQMK